MHSNIAQEWTQQHTRELHQEASAARMANVARKNKKDRSRPPKPRPRKT
jgi:hypothetical protein